MYIGSQQCMQFLDEQASSLGGSTGLRLDIHVRIPLHIPITAHLGPQRALPSVCGTSDSRRARSGSGVPQSLYI